MSDWLEIHGLADEQLSPEDRARAEARIGSDPEARRELEAIQGVKGILGARANILTSEETWQRCRSRLDEIDKSNRIESFVGHYAWAICCAFVLFIFGAGMFNRFRDEPRLQTADVPRLVSTLSPYMLTPRSQEPWDVVEFERQALGKAPLRINKSNSRREVVVVRGGQALIDGRHHVRLDMLDNGNPVTLYAVEGAEMTGVEPLEGYDGISYGRINDRNCVAWKDGDYSVVLVGDEPVEELSSLAASVGEK